MSKKVPVVKITTPHTADLAGLPLEATVAMADVAGAMREGLLAFSTAAGLVVMQQMLVAELASIVGPKHAKLGTDRVGNWHGTTEGQVVLGGRKVTVARPRGRLVDGGEVSLATWETFASEDLLRQVVVERMLAGVATRRHVDVAEPVGPIDASSVVSICCITTRPAAAENASSPSRIAPATSLMATVASNGNPARSAVGCGVVIFTTGTFFIGDPSLVVECLGGPPTPTRTAGTGEGSPPHFNRPRDNLPRKCAQLTTVGCVELA